MTAPAMSHDDQRTPNAPMSDERMQMRYGPMTPEVLAFYNRLRHIPLESWIDIAVRGEADSSRAEAARAAEEAADSVPGAVVRVRRAVEGIASGASAFAHPTDVARMARVATAAALALVARADLEAPIFERVYGVFADVIPAEGLGDERRLADEADR